MRTLVGSAQCLKRVRQFVGYATTDHVGACQRHAARHRFLSLAELIFFMTGIPYIMNTCSNITRMKVSVKTLTMPIARLLIAR